jgi:hypothetical protein
LRPADGWRTVMCSICVEVSQMQITWANLAYRVACSSTSTMVPVHPYLYFCTCTYIMCNVPVTVP